MNDTQATARRIAVLDFGGQYAHLLARRFRNLGLYSELHAPEGFVPEEHEGLAGVVLSGGPRSVTSAERPALAFDLTRCPVPVLGICYGHQLIAASLGGRVVAGRAPEYGLTTVHCEPQARLFRGLAPEQRVWMSHGDHVEALPPGLRAAAWSDRVAVAAFEATQRPLFGLQFHPEVTHSEHGLEMLDRFLALCGPERPWRPEAMAQVLERRIREQAEDKRLFLLLSGGVDSLVALALCVRAVGPERVLSLHVDTGFMRQGESDEVLRWAEAAGFGNLHVARAERAFLERLEGVLDPEEKRGRIGALFVEVMREQLARLPLGEDWLLVQGTIYPDTIESGGTKMAAKIKTHHNRVPEIERLLSEGKVIEPLAELYKDEVRQLGRQLGLPHALVDRQPFPGPGLAIRLLASDGREPAGFDAEEDRVRALVAPEGLLATVLPVRSVGVQGDSRTYRHPAVVWPRGEGLPPWAKLKACAARVVNQLESINRVVLALQPLPPGALRLRPLLLERDRIDLLRQVDALVRERTDGMDGIWQSPVVGLPLFDSEGRQAFVIRPVCSQDAMTAEVYEMDVQALRALASEAAGLRGVGPLLYDLTTKPPATIEWE